MDRTFSPLDTRDPVDPFRPASSLPALLTAAAVVIAAAVLTLAADLAWAHFRLDPQQPPAPAAIAVKTPAEAQAKTRPTVKKAVVPFVMLPTNHMLVEARINGKGPYHLIFDLGAPITLLNNQVSEASGVVKDDAPARSCSGCGVRPRSRNSRPAS